eukprot:365862-Chlamydomonas_euryale.AAC.11
MPATKSGYGQPDIPTRLADEDKSQFVTAGMDVKEQRSAWNGQGVACGEWGDKVRQDGRRREMKCECERVRVGGGEEEAKRWGWGWRKGEGKKHARGGRRGACIHAWFGSLQGHCGLGGPAASHCDARRAAVGVGGRSSGSGGRPRRWQASQSAARQLRQAKVGEKRHGAEGVPEQRQRRRGGPFQALVTTQRREIPIGRKPRSAQRRNHGVAGTRRRAVSSSSAAAATALFFVDEEGAGVGFCCLAEKVEHGQRGTCGRRIALLDDHAGRRAGGMEVASAAARGVVGACVRRHRGGWGCFA